MPPLPPHRIIRGKEKKEMKKKGKQGEAEILVIHNSISCTTYGGTRRTYELERSFGKAVRKKGGRAVKQQGSRNEGKGE